MDRATSATILLVAGAFTACAGSTKPPAPTAQETETQRKARGDLEQCNNTVGGKAYNTAVTPEGKYSFQIVGMPSADAVLACMASKGYSGTRLDNTVDHGTNEMRRSGGEGRLRGN